jgi:expansin (peptidoglycan-binding protein)
MILRSTCTASLSSLLLIAACSSTSDSHPIETEASDSDGTSSSSSGGESSSSGAASDSGHPNDGAPDARAEGSSGVGSSSGDASSSGSGSGGRDPEAGGGAEAGRGAESGVSTEAGAVAEAGCSPSMSTTCGSDPAPQSFQVGLTHYAQTSANNCGVPWPTNESTSSGTGSGMYLALSTSLYNDPTSNAACGKCVQVTGTTGVTKTLLVVDQCPATSANPSCSSDHLDLSQTAYDALEPGQPGSISNGSVAAKFVPCPVTGNIIYHVTTYNAYYVALVVLNSRYGIERIQYRASGCGGWTAMSPPSIGTSNGQPDITKEDPHWVLNAAVPHPIDLQVTDERGQVLEDDGIVLSQTDIPGGSQFPSCP